MEAVTAAVSIFLRNRSYGMVGGRHGSVIHAAWPGIAPSYIPQEATRDTTLLDLSSSTYLPANLATCHLPNLRSEVLHTR